MRKAQWYDKIFHWTLFDAALRWQLRFSTFGNHRSTLYKGTTFWLDGFSMEHMKDTGSSTPWTKGKSVSTTSGYHSQLSAGWLWQAIRTQSTLCLQWSFPAADRSHCAVRPVVSNVLKNWWKRLFEMLILDDFGLASVKPHLRRTWTPCCNWGGDGFG